MQQNEPLDLSSNSSSRPRALQINEDAEEPLDKQTICDRILHVNLTRRDTSKNKFLASLELTPVSLKDDSLDIPLFGYSINNYPHEALKFLRGNVRPYTAIYWSILIHHNVCLGRKKRRLDDEKSQPDVRPLDLSLRKGVFEVTSLSENEVKSVVKQKQKRYRTEKPFECSHCSAKFTLRSNMIRHTKQQHVDVWNQREDRRLLGLSEFPKEQISDWPKEIPLRESGPTPGPVPSSYYFNDDSNPGCNFLSSLVSILPPSKRKSAYSTAPNRVSCPYCSREFPWNSSLRRHILTHTGQKPFKCDSCPLLFTTKSNCDRHTVRKHVGSDKCMNSKGSESSSNGSERESSQDESQGSYASPFKCYLCNSAHSDRQGALDHLRDAHSLNFASLMPTMSMASVTTVDSSSDSVDDNHETVKCNRKVICALCRRRFWSAEDLRRHVRTHTGERPFSCEVCSRRFTLKHSMLRHSKKHQSDIRN